MDTTYQEDKIFTDENVSTADDVVRAYPLQLTPSGGWYFNWPCAVQTLPRRLTDPLFGREELNQRLRGVVTAVPSIEQVWEITKRLPSLSRLLSEERDNE